jgi:hypothetical protein
MTSSVPEPDDDLADVHVQRFNEAFYRTDPADYLLTRLQLLLLTGGKRAELEAMLHSGVEFAGFAVAQQDPDVADVRDDQTMAADAADHQSFLTVESQALLHLAAETLLRMFLVHAEQSNVPWVPFRGTPWRRFVALVQSILDTPPSPDLVAFVCLGSRQRSDAVTEADWTGAVDGLTRFLRHLAAVFLEDANLYNCIKHGLGARGGEAQMILGSTVFGDGPSVEFPEVTDWDAQDERVWSLTTRWVDVGESIALTHVAASMASSIWRVGRARLMGKPFEGRFFFPVELRPVAVRSQNRTPGTRVSWQHLSERKR